MIKKIPVLMGILVFVSLLTLPLTLKTIGGNVEIPQAQVIKSENGAPASCIEDREYMRANHMKFLMKWKHQVFDGGERSYVNRQGQTFDISLTGTCLGCHSNKEQFCGACHSNIGAKIPCFDCHTTE
jgi:hypothetical protein